MTSLDETDRQILKILARSGREPLKRLANTVGLSRTTLTARLRRLEREGFIQGYCAILSSSITPRPNQAVLLVKLDKTPAYGIVDAIGRLTRSFNVGPSPATSTSSWMLPPTQSKPSTGFGTRFRPLQGSPT